MKRLSRVIVREGADARTLGMFNIAVVQELFLYGSDMWFMYPHIMRALGGFFHQVVRRLTG